MTATLQLTSTPRHEAARFPAVRVTMVSVLSQADISQTEADVKEAPVFDRSCFTLDAPGSAPTNTRRNSLTTLQQGADPFDLGLHMENDRLVAAVKSPDIFLQSSAEAAGSPPCTRPLVPHPLDPTNKREEDGSFR